MNCFVGQTRRFPHALTPFSFWDDLLCLSIRCSRDASNTAVNLRTNMLMKRIHYFQIKLYSTYYEILEVSKNADVKTLKKSYYTKCKKLHPDVLQGRSDLQEEFMKVQKAYEVLKVEETRRQYDIYLKSMDRSHHDFVEWKAYKKNNAYERNYQKYNTGQQSDSGIDAEWSDFTFRDVFALFVVTGMIIYIVYNEHKMKQTNMPRSHNQWKQYYFNDLAGSHQNKTAHTKYVNKNSVATNNTSPAATKAKPVKVKNHLLAKTNGVFEEIKLTSQVSEETINKIKEKYKNVPITERQDKHLNTWSKV